MQPEPTIHDLYGQYKAKPSKENLNSVVQALSPTINYALASVNSANDPLVRSKAMLFAAKAIQKYDPSFGASLPTFISGQLRQLSRTARQSRSIVKIPERIQLDAYRLYEAEKKFHEQHGREPDTLELADHTGFPVKRIEKIRKFSYAVPAESVMPSDMEQEMPNFEGEAVDYVYHDADHIDRKILEHKTGYGGNPILAPKDIAVKLALTPSQLSRRSTKLTLKINDVQNALSQV